MLGDAFLLAFGGVRAAVSDLETLGCPEEVEDAGELVGLHAPR